MRLSLAVTTHERPEALAAVLQSVLAQRRVPDELIVADDGSGSATGAVIADCARRAGFPLRHVRQEHEGFRASRLRNRAIAAATGDYMVLIDGDMVLHRDFLADHCHLARPGFYTQGVRVMLDEARSRALAAAPLQPPGPASTGVGGLRRLYLLRARALQRPLRSVANGFVSIKGCNQGFWRRDLLAVNGYDEAFIGWGPEDKELCARLVHSGVRRQTLVAGGIAFHLHHPAASRAHRADNERLLAQTLQTGRRRCTLGLDSHLQAAGVPQG
jgi:glycosyltransferase involved in cell wall biosynthesis